MKVYAKEEGVECFSPRACFKAAFQIKLIDYDETWLKMLDDRNLTAHVYKEKYAEEVYSRLFDYVEYFKKLLSRLRKEEE
ncbi:MAG: nucleotidyltransferase substrate binding protein [Candidatus Omnitrophica bacterium]|nr:nucleotidyltransferase substrate binding protein [Candidatus Omnitrophota bacterium]